MKIKREILAKLIADLAKIVFALLVVGKFVHTETISWQVFFISCFALTVLGIIVWLVAPREEEVKCRTK